MLFYGCAGAVFSHRSHYVLLRPGAILGEYDDDVDIADSFALQCGILDANGCIHHAEQYAREPAARGAVSKR